MNDDPLIPTAHGDFYACADDLPDAPTPGAESPAALERLGPSPFPKSGFPFLGFLATVYDHIATHVDPDHAPAATEAPSTPAAG